MARHHEPQPIADTCEAVAYLYHDQLPSEVYQALAHPDQDHLIETIWNLIQLRPNTCEPQLAMPLGDPMPRGP